MHRRMAEGHVSKSLSKKREGSVHELTVSAPRYVVGVVCECSHGTAVGKKLGHVVDIQFPLCDRNNVLGAQHSRYRRRRR